MALARERWKFLRKVLLEKRKDLSTYELDSSSSVSVRRFSTFELFTVSTSQTGQRPVGNTRSTAGEEKVEWVRYTYETSSLSLSVDIALLPQRISAEDLQGFNNTGNVCIWPAEEVMAFYCLRNRELFSGASVCELGAGMTGLAGVFLAKTGLPKEVVITDGNKKSVSNLQSIITHDKINCLSNEKVSVSAEVVIWKDTDVNSMYSHLKERFDFLICADCLFFSAVHKPLIALLLYLLKPEGCILMFAPERSGTLQAFYSLAQERFNVEVSEHYLDTVWEKHVTLIDKVSSYNPDIHYPKLMTMKLKK